MVASIKILKLISATVYEIKRGVQYSKKRNIPILKMSIRNKPPCDYRLIDVIGGSANPRNTSQQKLIKEADAINIQINKNFLVLMMSSRRRHYRF